MAKDAFQRNKPHVNSSPSVFAIQWKGANVAAFLAVKGLRAAAGVAGQTRLGGAERPTDLVLTRGIIRRDFLRDWLMLKPAERPTAEIVHYANRQQATELARYSLHAAWPTKHVQGKFHWRQGVDEIQELHIRASRISRAPSGRPINFLKGTVVSRFMEDQRPGSLTTDLAAPTTLICITASIIVASLASCPTNDNQGTCQHTNAATSHTSCCLCPN